ncbi:plasmid mobilization protein [Nocardia neocaledoniensis]|uniref:plasmid mobilization protein n=1 Tax=Nocardia neocaledoniensis TaxID=236511 RepID=UPI002454B696|nr:plasmid mobilization relaxosome protein MobC [Nocardia neocaledoniensis]
MAGASTNRRAESKRERQKNVAGGRQHRTVVKLSDDEHATLTELAQAARMTVPRLLVETARGTAAAEAGRVEAVRALLDLDNQVRAVGNNLNQLTRYSHQDKELAEGLEYAIAAAMRACLQIDATARWVMGKAPAVSAESLAGTLLADDVDTSEWADSIDPD